MKPPGRRRRWWWWWLLLLLLLIPDPTPSARLVTSHTHISFRFLLLFVT